jgi:hypothetical protein
MKYLSIIFLILLSLRAEAGTVSRLTDFTPGTKAEADEVDAEFDNIISTLNGNINSVNILDGGIVTADLATASVTADKITSYTITQVKMGSLGQQLSSLISSQSVTGFSTENAASVTLSTYGRPVFVGLIPSSAASSDTSTIVVSNTIADTGIGTNAVGNMLLARNTQAGTSSHVTRWLPSIFAAATADLASSPNNTLRSGFAPGQFWTIDPVDAGTWTYVLRISGNTTGSVITLRNLKLIAFEL